MGHGRFSLFYLVCGIAAVFAQALANPRSAYPIIGASGAISGVLGAYLLLFPRARVLTLVLLPFFVTTVRMPAMLLLLLWFAVQLVSDLAARRAVRASHFARTSAASWPGCCSHRSSSGATCGCSPRSARTGARAGLCYS